MPAGLASAPVPATTPAPPSASAREPGDVVVSIGTSGTVFAVTDAPTADASGAVAGFADASGRLPAAGRHAQRGPHPRRDRRPARRRPRRTRPARPRRSTRSRRPRAAALLRGRAHPQPARRHGHPVRHDARRRPPARTWRAPPSRGCCARSPTVSTRCAPRASRRAASCSSAGAAQNPAVSAIAAQVFDVPVVVPDPGEYVAAGAAVQAAWMLTGDATGLAVEHRRRAGARHPARDPRRVRRPAMTQGTDLLRGRRLRRPVAPVRRELRAARRGAALVGRRPRGRPQRRHAVDGARRPAPGLFVINAGAGPGPAPPTPNARGGGARPRRTHGGHPARRAPVDRTVPAATTPGRHLIGARWIWDVSGHPPARPVHGRGRGRPARRRDRGLRRSPTRATPGCGCTAVARARLAPHDPEGTRHPARLGPSARGGPRRRRPARPRRRVVRQPRATAPCCERAATRRRAGPLARGTRLGVYRRAPRSPEAVSGVVCRWGRPASSNGGRR